MARKRKIRKGERYKYKTGRYVREKLGEPRNVRGYRVVEVKPGRKLLVAVTGKQGPRGGRTKAVALLRSTSTAKGRSLAKRARTKTQKRRRRRR